MSVCTESGVRFDLKLFIAVGLVGGIKIAGWDKNRFTSYDLLNNLVAKEFYEETA